MIPAAAPQLRFARFSAAIDRAVRETLAGTSLILGERVEAFEQRFASYLGVPYCVGVNSGTDAVGLALRACGVGRGVKMAGVRREGRQQQHPHHRSPFRTDATNSRATAP